MTSKPWHRPFKVFDDSNGQEILYACFLVSTARHTELTSWRRIKRIKWDKRLCLGSVWYHWPKRWDIHVNANVKKYWSFLQSHPPKKWFHFQSQKSQQVPSLRIWLNALHCIAVSSNDNSPNVPTQVTTWWKSTVNFYLILHEWETSPIAYLN